MIRIQMLTGPNAGLQTTHQDTKLTFGRSPDNTLAVDVAYLSRQHGELVCEDGQWFAVNHSPNGTTVNGKAVKADEPRPLKTGDVVGVGSEKLFTVAVAPAGGEEVDAIEEPEAAPKKPAMSRRAKMWTGIGAYMALMAIVIILLATAGGEKTSGRSMPPQLTDEQIARDIREPIERLPDERKAAEHLQEARDWMSRPNARVDAVYQAHRNYKLTMAYANTSTLPEDQLQFNAVETKLINTITEKYRRTYAMLLNKQWTDAETELRRLSDMYPDTTSKIHKSVQQLLRYVLAQKPKGKSFG